ncbi:HpcH/HpaI aldolase family protein [Phyllobacterium lublinensis]|jgi:4-hydroxy-2-oxoheptanedioate aldolase|uniref:HpcH/HpaI aldolase family protein n=1 Tax=Phyllobacterium lublinensis TaxID=2875708 RepID=UPI001CCB7647|nr:aldolase/citrate lyase family protein [Phyllobacterium sp. 2063]MBZ9653750.1 aldolase [Phyllobacterium sp. 2063]
MANLPRLNGIIRALEQNLPAFTSFAMPDITTALAFSKTKYDGVVFEMEHNHYDVSNLRDSLQYLLNRELIAKSGSVAPAVTPIVRIPPNGSEMNQFIAKQVLDVGAYGVVWPHISTAEEAYNAVSACRYSRPKSAENYEPAGIRGDGPGKALRYWGVSQKEYYERADVWPLVPTGEILVVTMIEDSKGVGNLDDILSRVDGIGIVLIGEGDLSQDLGHPRDYEHPVVREAMAHVVATCKKHNVVVGHPHVNKNNVESVLQQGYRFLMAGPTTSYPALEKGLELSGRQSEKASGGNDH